MKSRVLFGIAGLLLGLFAPWKVSAVLVAVILLGMAVERIGFWLYERATTPVDDEVVERLSQTVQRRRSEHMRDTESLRAALAARRLP